MISCCAPTARKHRDYWHNCERLKHGSCTAVVLLLLCCSCTPGTDFVIAHTPRAHTWYTHKSINSTHTHRSTVCVREISQRGCCCTVTATSTEPGGPCVMQQHSSTSRARKMLTYGLRWALRGSAKQDRRLHGPCSVDLVRCDHLPDSARRAQQLEEQQLLIGANLPGSRAEGAVLARARCVTCSVRGVQQESQG